MIVAAHQPGYLPWLGYLHKIAHSDVFVLMDDMQYEAQNFQNRNRVKMSTGAQWLTVPLARGPREERICDKRINNVASDKEHWQRRTLLSLKNAYGRAPHFARYADDLEDVYTQPWDKLVDLDVHLLQLLLRWFGISRPILRASSLGLEGQRTARIVDMCKRLGADVYLSGKGGSVGYLEVERFDEVGVRVAWQEFAHPVYPQRYPSQGFVPHLSALDMLLNCGPDSHALLLGEQAAAATSQAHSAADGAASGAQPSQPPSLVAVER